MKRLFLPLAALLSLSGCIGGLTPGQTLYATLGSYEAASAGAVEYANSPTASPAVVHRLNQANQSAQPVVKYARAYVQCKGKNETVVAGVAGVDCRVMDFSRKTVSGYIVQLRAVVVTLTGR